VKKETKETMVKELGGGEVLCIENPKAFTKKNQYAKIHSISIC
jgi:hypothetical protein